MIIEQIAIAVFLFTVNSLFLESSRGFGVLWTTTIAALLAPSKGIFKAVVRAYYEVYKRINAA